MKGYKTLAFALLIAVGGVVQTFNWATVIPQDQKWSGMAMLSVGAVIAALRFVTNTSVGQKMAIAFMIVAAALLGVAPSYAADLPLPVKAPAQWSLPKINCTPSKCSGPYLGIVVGTNTQDASLVPSFNTVSGGNGLVGGDIGARFWNGNVYIGAEFDALWQTGESDSVVSFNPQDALLIVEGKVGLSLAGMLGSSTAGVSQGPLQNVLNGLQADLMTPYVVPVADCIFNVGGGTWIQRYCGGVGAEFAIGGPISVSVEYLNEPAAGGLAAANFLFVKGNYNF